MNLMRTLTLSIFASIICFVAAICGLLSFVNNGRPINLILAIVNAILFVIDMCLAFGFAKIIDRHMESSKKFPKNFAD